MDFTNRYFKIPFFYGVTRVWGRIKISLIVLAKGDPHCYPTCWLKQMVHVITVQIFSIAGWHTRCLLLPASPPYEAPIHFQASKQRTTALFLSIRPPMADFCCGQIYCTTQMTTIHSFISSITATQSLFAQVLKYHKTLHLTWIPPKAVSSNRQVRVQKIIDNNNASKIKPAV